MVFPDGNPKKSIFLILYYDDLSANEIEWLDNINQFEEKIKDINNNYKGNIIFAGEIAILKDLTNIEK